MSLYLCVDCGGTKTSAVICNASGSIVGRALLGNGSNFAYLGLAAFASAVRTAVSVALQTCTSPPSSSPVDLPTPPNSSHSFAAAWLGVSGVDSPAASATIAPVLSEMLGIPQGPRLVIANDTHLLAAPVRLHPDISTAVAVIAGTGSICVSFKEQEGGKLEELGRVGGWGWILGDEGGGFYVGREAIRQILLEADRASVEGPAPPPATGKSTLKAKIFDLLNVKDALEILSIIHLPDPLPGSSCGEDCSPHVLMTREKRLSTLCPLVFASALDDADPLALKVLRTSAGLLAEQVTTLLRSTDDDDREFAGKAVKAEDSVICFGGSLSGVQAYRTMVLDELAKRGHMFRYVQFVDDPAAIGAAGLAAT